MRQEGVFDTGSRANNGVKASYSTTESKTFTTTTSANIGAAFEVFSAGIGYEYSEPDFFSVTEGYEFTPKCDGNQQGQAFFYPFSDYYDVTFSRADNARTTGFRLMPMTCSFRASLKCSVFADDLPKSQQRV